VIRPCHGQGGAVAQPSETQTGRTPVLLISYKGMSVTGRQGFGRRQNVFRRRPRQQRARTSGWGKHEPPVPGACRVTGES